MSSILTPGKLLGAICAAVFLLNPGVAMSEEAAAAAPVKAPQLDNFAIGFAIGATDAASRFEAQLTSPTLVSKTGNGFMAGEYSLIGGYGYYALRGIPVQDEADSQWTIATYGTLGLRIDMDSGYGAHRYYSTYEVVLLSPGRNLTDGGNDLGGRAGFGLEFPLSPRQNLYGKELTPALFVQGDITLGLGRADKLAGKPDLFNGVGVLIGSRTFF